MRETIPYCSLFLCLVLLLLFVIADCLLFKREAPVLWRNLALSRKHFHNVFLMK
jgi:hypothetical protein